MESTLTSDPAGNREASGSKPLVLLVDDRPETIASVEAALAPLGAEVVRAASPEAALDTVASKDFAVALINAHMRGMDGPELARRMNAAASARLTPIIFITALEEDRRRIHPEYESGAVDYLFMPLDPAELRAKVGAFVRLRRDRELEFARERRRFADLSGAAAEMAAERRARGILESITDAFYALDADFRLTYVNRRAEQMWGRRREELIGQDFWERFPEAVGGESYQRHIESMATREPAVFETLSPVLNRWIEVNLNPEPTGGLSCYFHDVTERKTAEADRERLVRQLESERARLATVFRDAPAFLAVLRGPTHVFELVNNAYYQLVGHRDLVGKPAFEALPDARGQGFEALIDRVYATGEPFIGREVPIALERTRGAPLEERFLDLTYLPLIEADGTRTGVVAYGLDVTDHVDARKEVERARDRIAVLQTMTASLARAMTPAAVAEAVVAQGVAATDAGTAVFALRDPADSTRVVVARTSGIPDDIVSARSSFRTTADSPAALSIRTGTPCFIESRDALLEQFASLDDLWTRLGTQSLAVVPVSASGDTLGAVSFGFSTPRSFTTDDRDFFRTLARQAALGLERARLIAALTHEREVAVRARTEAELARAEWERAASAKGQFLATMSHELRTPINAQIGYTQLLQLGVAGPLTVGQREYLERLGRNSEHLLSLVNDVLDLSKIEANQLTASRDEALSGAVVDAALDVVRPLAETRNIRLDDVRPDPNGVPYVGDEQRVRQVLVNLLSNAVKFTEPGGRIEIACSTEERGPEGASMHGGGPWAVIRVRDTGIGIDPNQLSRIFEPFHQVQGGHTRTQGGTGLGLAISRRLARIMGGDLTVESRKGEGSTFSLWLPATASATATGKPPVETADDRGARADRRTAREDAPDVARVGDIVRGALEEILDGYIARIRVDPDVPAAHGMTRPEIEDHMASLLADIGQAMFIVSRGGPDAANLLRDGSTIQRTIADHHGRRRHAQGFSERAVVRDTVIYREEVLRVVRTRLEVDAGADAPASAEPASNNGVAILVGLLDQVAAVALRAWRSAAQG